MMEQPTYKLLAIVSILLIISVFPLPYGYYTFTKIVVCGCAGFNCYYLWQLGNRGVWPYAWGTIAIIFNPLIPIPMQKEIWMIVDSLAGLVFAYSAYKSFNKKTME